MWHITLGVALVIVWQQWICLLRHPSVTVVWRCGQRWKHRIGQPRHCLLKSFITRWTFDISHLNNIVLQFARFRGYQTPFKLTKWYMTIKRMASYMLWLQAVLLKFMLPKSIDNLDNDYIWFYPCVILCNLQGDYTL